METVVTVRRGSLITPLALIALGFVFLLSNLGYLAWNPWDVAWRLWPLLLVAVGLDLLLGRRSAAGPWTVFGLLVAVVTLVAVATIGSLLLAPQRVVGWSANGPTVVMAGPVSSEQFSQPLENAQRADVTLNFGAGTLKVGAQDEPSGLVEGTVVRNQGERLSRNAHGSGDTIYFEMHDEGLPVSFGDNHGTLDNGRGWDLRLNPEVPMQLKINGGVGRSTLDLSRLNVTDLTVNTGIGESELTLPQSGELRATVKGGISDTTIFIPQGMAARIQVDRGLTSVDVAGNYRQQGNSYVSPGYEDARDRVDLAVKGGIGKITVQEYAVQ